MPSKKKPSGTRRPRARELEVEVVPELKTPDVVKHLAMVEKLLAGLDRLSDAKLLSGIKEYAGHAAGHARSAVESGASALVYAWACGTLLNAAKKRLGRGDFGDWREEHLGGEVMSERTSQRYMALARKWESAGALLEWSPTLRQAYVACGMLPEPPEREPDPAEDKEAARRQALLSSITGIQRKLRLFDGVKGKLEPAEKTQLKLAKAEIDAFFERILS